MSTRTYRSAEFDGLGHFLEQSEAVLDGENVGQVHGVENHEEKAEASVELAEAVPLVDGLVVRSEELPASDHVQQHETCSLGHIKLRNLKIL